MEGNIGYQAGTTTPKRRGDRTQPRTGWTGEDEWELLPFDELPSMLNPERNYIATANQLTAGSWYPYRVGSSIGGGPRSWRLRELFDADPERKFSPADFAMHIHRDSVCPAVRDLVDFALLALDDEDKADEQIAEAVAVLQDWDRRLLVDSPAFPLARKILDCLEEDFLQGSGLENYYSQKWAGVCALFNQLRRQVQQTGTLPDEPLVRQWLVNTFKKACYRRDQPLAPQADTTGWVRQVVQLEEPAAEEATASATYIRHMPYMGAPEGIGAERFGSLNPDADLLSPPLQCPLAQTIWSQGGQFLLPNRRSGRHRPQLGTVGSRHQRKPGKPTPRRPSADLGNRRVSGGTAGAHGSRSNRRVGKIHFIQRIRFQTAAVISVSPLRFRPPPRPNTG